MNAHQVFAVPARHSVAGILRAWLATCSGTVNQNDTYSLHDSRDSCDHTFRRARGLHWRSEPKRPMKEISPSAKNGLVPDAGPRFVGLNDEAS